MIPSLLCALLLLGAGGTVVKAADVATIPPEPPPGQSKGKPAPPLRTRLLIDGVSAGATRAALSVLEVAPKARVALHRHPASAEVLYVLDGRGRLIAPGAETVKLDPGVAVFIAAGAPHSIDVTSPQKGLRLLQVYAPPGPEAVLRDRTKPSGTELVKDPAAKAAAGSITAVDTTRLEPLTPGPKRKVTLALDQQAQAYLGILEAEAGAVVPEHAHDGSAELLYVLAGKGTVTIGGRALELGPDCALHIPEQAPHEATFESAFKAVQIYAPSGPEKRWKK
jgi:quercetin dioxygenase-like cupin family protein